ncbi:MAG TPA: SAM-dependent methyltransferase [Chthonomonadaceae bacterium]|nr:SAM-dependent methyltransferase [Chthonomonadaceae bacterium]
MHSEAPSGTATLIAGSFAAAGRDPVVSAILPAKSSELGAWVIGDTYPNGRLLLWALRQGWGRAIARLVERLVLPGIQAHYIVRKRFIEDAARAALELGAGQVVNVGAGFDSLCWRLHSDYPAVQFVEIDHPATQRTKRQVLDAHCTLGPNFTLVPADLTVTDLGKALIDSARFDPALPTIFVVEGLLMYLTEQEARRLFGAVGSLRLPEATVVFTFMEPLADGRVHFPHASPFVNWWLRRRGEPFQWGIRREALPAFLAEQGFEQIDFADEGLLRQRYLAAPRLAGLPLAEGELIAIAKIK